MQTQTLTQTSLFKGLAALPQINERVAAPTRYPTSPDVSGLTAHQAVAYGEILEFLDNPNAYMHLLEGYAGVGKSFITSKIVEYALADKNISVAFTATTHKAVKVIKDMGAYDSPNLDYLTIHSLLGLKERINPVTGAQEFAQIDKDACKITNYKLVIVDEVSQLSDDLFELIAGYVGPFSGIKIIFVGDGCQIPPVGKEDCIPLSAQGREAYNISRSVLTEVVRQAADNPIIGLSMKVRGAMARPLILPLKETKYNPSTFDGVYFMGQQDKQMVWDLLNLYYNSQNFKADGNFVKVVAWRNKTVATFNSIIRKMIYGPTAARICMGERLVANRPITQEVAEDGSDDYGAWGASKKPTGPVMIFNNNDEFEVTDFTVTQGSYRGAELTYYDTEVVQETANGQKVKRIKIVHEDSMGDYELILNHLKEVANSHKRGSWEFSQAWRDVYNFQEIWADVSYAYAGTAHRAQGSTYTNVFVIDSDIDANRKVLERNRIKYTAYTRPSNKLFICGD